MQGKYSFARFTGRQPGGSEKISIGKLGNIRFPAGFYRKADLKSFNYVILFYDSKLRAIAFKFIVQPELGSFKLTRERSTAATISALSFLKTHNLHLRSFRDWYDLKKISDPDLGRIFVIELGKK